MNEVQYHIAQGMPHIDEKRKQRLDDFGCYVSVLPWFNIDVLHKLYINIFEKEIDLKNLTKIERDKIRAITCGDFLQSPKVDLVSLNTYTIRREIRDHLRNCLRKNKNQCNRIGRFMLAYVQDCKSHFLTPKYREVFRIEGNLIVNPDKEAYRITQHIAQQINQIKNATVRKETVSYYLNILDDNGVLKGFDELKSFMKGYNKELRGEETKWEQVPNLNEKVSNSSPIKIRLPRKVKSNILKEITARYENKKCHVMIVGINNEPNLTACSSDVSKIQNFFKQFDTKTSTLTLLEFPSTKKDFLYRLDKVIDKMKSGDTFIFYFAGRRGAVELPKEEGGGYEQVFFFTDTYQGDPPLTFKELIFHADKMPEGCELVTIFDAGMTQGTPQKIKGFVNLRSRSMSNEWKKRINFSEEYYFINDGFSNYGGFFDRIKYTCLEAAAVGTKNDAYENDEGGVFTNALIQSLESFVVPRPLHVLEKKIKENLPEKLGMIPNIFSNQKNSIFLSGFLKYPIYEQIRRVQRGKTTELLISDQNISEIPHEIFLLENMTKIDLSKNPLRQNYIPKYQSPLAETNELGKLETLILDDCQLDNNDDIKNLIDSSRLPALKKLSLRNNNFTRINPEWFTENRDLEIDFTGNPIEYPEGISLKTTYQKLKTFLTKDLTNLSSKEEVEINPNRVQIIRILLDEDKTQLNLEKELGYYSKISRVIKPQFHTILGWQTTENLIKETQRFIGKVCAIIIDGKIYSESFISEMATKFAEIEEVKNYVQDIPFIFISDYQEDLNSDWLDQTFEGSTPLIIKRKKEDKEGLSGILKKSFFQHFFEGLNLQEAYDAFKTADFRLPYEFSFPKNNSLLNMNWSIPLIEKENYENKFLSQEEIYATLESEKGITKDKIIDHLLILSTSNQQTWIIATEEDLHYLLDDENTRRKKRICQRAIPIQTAAHNEVRAIDTENNQKVVYVGNPEQRPWYYSAKLFPTHYDIEKAIGQLIRNTLDAAENLFTWVNPKIYINNIDGQLLPLLEALTKEPNIFIVEKEEADCWLNIFNHTLYFSAPNNPYRPWGRPLDMFEDYTSKLEKKLLTLVNFIRLKNSRNKKKKSNSNSLLKIELRPKREKEWITPGDEMVFKPEKIQVDLSAMKFNTSSTKHEYDLRITNISDKKIYVGGLALYSDLGISGMAFKNETIVLEPNESRHIYDYTKHTPYILLNEYNLDYHWKEEQIIYKFFIHDKIFNIEKYNQKPLWGEWTNFPRETEKVVAPPEVNFVEEFKVTLENPKANDYDKKQLKRFLEKPIEAPIISNLHKAFLRDSGEFETPFILGEYLEEIHQLDKKLWKRKFEKSNNVKVLAKGNAGLISFRLEKDVLYFLQKDYAVKNSPFYYLENDFSYLNRLEEEANKHSINSILIFDIPEILRSGDPVLFKVNGILDVFRYLDDLNKKIIENYSVIAKANKSKNIVVVGLDYFSISILANDSWIQNIRQTEITIRNFVDSLSKELIQLQSEIPNLKFIDLRNFTNPKDDFTLWSPSEEMCQRLAEKIKEALNHSSQDTEFLEA